jgi:probable O-glycosylation ligase (exosortase A-associated)
VTDAKRFGLVLLVMGLSLGLEGAKQGWAHMLLHPGAVNMNPITFLGDNNGVGVGMLMLAPLLLVSGGLRKSRGARHAFTFLAVGVIFRALTTYSRGAMISGAALAASLLVRVRGRRIISAAVGVALIGSVVLAMLPDEYWDRMATVFTWSEEGSAAGRTHFWKVALAMADENRLLGVGFAGYSLSYDAYDPTEGEFGTRRACHSSWFGVLADLGVPGLALFVAIFVSAFKTCRRVLALARAHPESEALAEMGRYASALRYSLVAFIVGGTFVSMQYNEMIWHLLSLSIALEAIARRTVADLSNRETAETTAVDAPPATEELVPQAGEPA